MKKLIAVLLTALSLAAIAAPNVVATATRGNDQLVLLDAPCTLDKAKEVMPAAMFAVAHAATARVDGADFTACWVRLNDYVGVVYDDGDQSMIPAKEFKAPVKI